MENKNENESMNQIVEQQPQTSEDILSFFESSEFEGKVSISAAW